MAIQELKIIRRDDATLNVTFKNKTTNVPIDITGSKVYFTVKRRYLDTDAHALVVKETTSHSDPTNGKTSIVLNQVDTDQAEGSYYYDFQIKDAANRITSTLRGVFTIVNDITIRTS